MQMILSHTCYGLPLQCSIVSDGELTSQDQWACTLDFSQLKFRERDDVEFTLQFWRNTKKSFDMEKLRWGRG